MDPKELAKTLGEAMALALGEGLAEGIATGKVDDAFAKMIESLSDQRLGAKTFPDGRYVPPKE